MDEKQYVIFNMISENSSTVMAQLDHIRKERKKFICLNDNINHYKEGADLAKLILVDFYETLFPIISQFELPPQYQNRFLHTTELREWCVCVCVCVCGCGVCGCDMQEYLSRNS